MLINHNYKINTHWSEEDNAFISVVPELPGCMADGKTYSEVLFNVSIIIDQWIKTAKLSGRSVPKPKDNPA